MRWFKPRHGLSENRFTPGVRDSIL